MQKGHVKIKVSGTTYPLVIDTRSYSEVDIVDFAPRAVSGTPAFSEQGLYLDFAQHDFGHGFGAFRFGDASRYMYTGHQVDTRHGFVNLFTDLVEEKSEEFDFNVNRIIVHNGVTLLSADTGVFALKPSNGSWVKVDTTGTASHDLMDVNDTYAIDCNARLKLVGAGQVTGSTSNQVGIANATFETNILAGGKVVIFDGTGATQTKTIASNTSGNTIQITGTWSTNPDTTSYAYFYVNTGSDGNAPTGFEGLAKFGGFYWGYEGSTHYLHFWADDTGASAEGGGTTDTAVVEVGPAGGKIVNLMSFDNQLWVFREDGAWVVAEDNLAYHRLDFAGEAHADNFKTVIVWNGFLIFPVRNKLYKFKSGLQDITPPIFNYYPPHKQFGSWDGLVARGKFLYVIGTSNSDFDEETRESDTGFTAILATDGVGWHKLFTLDKITHGISSTQGHPDTYKLWLDQINDKILVSTGATIESDFYGRLDSIQLQSLSDLPYADYPTSGDHNLYTSYFDFGLERVPKSWASLTVGGDFPTNTSIDAEYRTDDTQSWTSIGTFSSDQQEIDLPDATEGKRIQFRFNLQTSDGTVSPVMRWFSIKAMIRPDVLYGVTCDVLLGDDQRDQHMLAQGLTAQGVRTALRAARSSVSPIEFTDLLGATADAYVASLRFITLDYQDENYVQFVARVTFVYV